MGVLPGKFGGSITLGRHVGIKNGCFYIKKHQNFDFRGFVDFYKVIGETQISYHWGPICKIWGLNNAWPPCWKNRFLILYQNTKYLVFLLSSFFFFFLLLSSCSSFFFFLRLRKKKKEEERRRRRRGKKKKQEETRRNKKKEEERRKKKKEEDKIFGVF